MNENARSVEDLPVMSYELDRRDRSYIERVYQVTGGSMWAVRMSDLALSIDGSWDHEPTFESKSNDWLTEHRWATAEEAHAAWRNRR